MASTPSNSHSGKGVVRVDEEMHGRRYQDRDLYDDSVFKTLMSVTNATKLALSRTAGLTNKVGSLGHKWSQMGHELNVVRQNQDTLREQYQHISRQLETIMDLLKVHGIGGKNCTVERESVNSAGSYEEKSQLITELPKLDKKAPSGVKKKVKLKDTLRQPEKTPGIELGTNRKSGWTTSPRQVQSNFSGMLPPAIGLATPRKFSGAGEESFGDFLQHFRTVSVLNNWDETVAAVQLDVCLEGQAQKLALELQEKDRRDYQTLVAHMKRRLYCPVQEYDFVRRFYGREKSPDESATEFATALQTLARDAFPGRNEQEVDNLIKRQLVNGYDDPSVAVALAIDNRECSLWDLIKRAVEVSDVLKVSKNPTVRKPIIAQVETKKKDQCADRSDGGDHRKLLMDIEKEMRQLKITFMKELEELKSNGPNRPLDYRPRRKFEGNCGRYGHLARFCRVLVCDNCGKVGHAIDKCLSLPRGPRKR